MAKHMAVAESQKAISHKNMNCMSIISSRSTESHSIPITVCQCRLPRTKVVVLQNKEGTSKREGMVRLASLNLLPTVGGFEQSCMMHVTTLGL